MSVLEHRDACVCRHALSQSHVLLNHCLRAQVSRKAQTGECMLLCHHTTMHLGSHCDCIVFTHQAFLRHVKEQHSSPAAREQLRAAWKQHLESVGDEAQPALAGANDDLIMLMAGPPAAAAPVRASGDAAAAALAAVPAAAAPVRDAAAAASESAAVPAAAAAAPPPAASAAKPAAPAAEPAGEGLHAHACAWTYVRGSVDRVWTSHFCNTLNTFCTLLNHTLDIHKYTLWPLKTHTLSCLVHPYFIT